ncbi:MAG: ABC transporter permease [Phycisphaeraceae bacterium]|nr:ABC transporter permease [Phycisphaeraceae bacterium]
MIILRLLLQTVVLAISQIWANRFRAVLTTLGVIIGVAAIIAVVGAMTGAERFILSQFEKIGTRRVFLDGMLPDSMRTRTTWREVQLKEREILAMLEHCPSLEKISPMYYGGYSIQYGDKKIESVSVVGIWPEWHDIEGRSVIIGRPFTSIDEQLRQMVCLVNDQAITEMGLPSDPTGEETWVLIGGRRFLVVGVVETIQLAGMFGGGDSSTEVFIPFSTARLLNPWGHINMAWGQLRSADRAADVEGEVRFVLRNMRGLEPGDDDTFMVRVFQQFIDQFRAVAGALTAILGAIVSISLLVGGIGIMNIMLVSVSERTREIGLRKAVGARPAVILMQFLVESVVLCLMGAGIGWAIGQGLVLLVRSLPDSPLPEASVPPWAVLLSIGFSVFIGVVFGMFPAIKAARLDPIVALRHE